MQFIIKKDNNDTKDHIPGNEQWLYGWLEPDQQNVQDPARELSTRAIQRIDSRLKTIV